MNILIIITPYTPAQDPNTIRWSGIADFFKKEGHNVHILTTKRNPLPHSTIEKGIHIHRTGYHTLLDWFYNLIGAKNRRHEPGYTPDKKASQFSFIQKIIDLTWRKHYWPDGQKLFLKPGIRLGQKILKDHSIDQIISVGAPFTPHWIAHALKKVSPETHWHMDIQDPFCYAVESAINNYSKYKEKNYTVEKSCFTLAESISVPSQRSAERYKEIFPEAKNKLKLIPPIFLPPQIRSTGFKLETSKIHLAYFGSFYESIRSPHRLLELLAYLKTTSPDVYNQLDIHILGQQNPYSLKCFNSSPSITKDLKFHGFMPRDDAMSVLTQMDFLINFGNKTDYHLPSRVVEYLYLNKPTINFCEIHPDSFAHFINEEIAILNLLPDHDLSEQHTQFIEFLKSSSTDNPVDPDAVQAYLPGVIGQQYLDLFG